MVAGITRCGRAAHSFLPVPDGLTLPGGELRRAGHLAGLGTVRIDVVVDRVGGGPQERAEVMQAG